MYCKRCGAQIDTTKRQADGSVVCPGCGLIYRQKAASAPARAANPAQVREAAPAPRPAVNDTAGGTPKRGLNPVLIILAVLILIGAAAGAILYFRGSGKTGSASSGKTPGTQYTQTSGQNDTPKKEITVPCLYAEWHSSYYDYADMGELQNNNIFIENYIYTYEYNANGLIEKLTLQEDAEELLISYFFVVDDHGYPKEIWTGVEYTQSGIKYSMTADKETRDNLEDGEYNEHELDIFEDILNYLIHVDIENTYYEDGTMTARLYNPWIAGETVSFEEDWGISTLERSYRFRQVIGSRLAESPKYCNAGIFWGLNGVVRKNGKQIYSCNSNDPYKKREVFLEEINGCQRATVRDSSRGSDGEGEWEVEVETITETDPDGYIVSYREGDGVSYTESIVIREDESNSVTVRIIDPDTGTVVRTYLYDKSGIPQEVKDFSSDNETYAEYDRNGYIIKSTIIFKTSYDVSIRTVTEYTRGEFTLYE